MLLAVLILSASVWAQVPSTINDPRPDPNQITEASDGSATNDAAAPANSRDRSPASEVVQKIDQANQQTKDMASTSAVVQSNKGRSVHRRYTKEQMAAFVAETLAGKGPNVTGEGIDLDKNPASK